MEEGASRSGTTGGSCARAVLAAAVCCLILAGCSKTPPPQRAFYYWKSRFALTTGEETCLRDVHASRLYLHCFDVVWDEGVGQPLPVAEVVFGARPAVDLEIVPVVYIANDALRRLASGAVGALAVNIAKEIDHRMEPAARRIDEVQMDCDWTPETRDRYFALLRSLKMRYASRGIRLSATIRLHQVKYRERTGVPPADRGMLMAYNLGPMSTAPGRNSIYMREVAVQYTARVMEYPLPLDAALPVYAWTLHFRGGKAIGILNKTVEADLEATGKMRKVSGSTYVASEPFFLHGSYIQRTDTLKVERAGPSACLDAARQIAPVLRPEARAIALFELDSLYLASHDAAQLDAVYRAFE